MTNVNTCLKTKYHHKSPIQNNRCQCDVVAEQKGGPLKEVATSEKYDFACRNIV